MNNKKIVDDVELNYSLCSEIDIFFIPIILKIEVSGKYF